ncbi:triose-phosphate isomerase [Helicobacter saguini]|uniref:Triosephosphate isomerase n=1 Tax=Helicobacter saguini TaxID=1548018 RepID=A0A347VPK6_9HELI|nr:triose-phosphate isomerase [Helicobacter saguini]MWV61315.1 triose-phosphate isomerase [Helicobacter saguini]MWV68016.1 triose-phosphate isomerase [Helicobacter saguini]MWV70517.1 triose-phosphate isomerase [Helicobacter saguini]MWV72420.1 triose-phosphate isomerase [Helicobacter saguini]TLD94815.1 triose-phosphate isomerase [Helicobacter saguini]
MKTIAANLKANHTPKSIITYLNNLESKVSKIDTKNVEIIIFPNQACLQDNTFPNFNLGAQNAYPAKNGAFSGEIGLEVLQSLNINHIMLGHSERRGILGESDEFICQKFEFFAAANMRIMLCVGEDSNIKKQGKIAQFLESQLAKIDTSYPLLTIAYEPLWAIGSGVTPTLSEIESVVKILQNLNCKKILYGGSVSEKNMREICSVADGVLVGSASLDSNNFANMISKVV